MKVLGVGEVVLDNVHLLDTYPKEGTKIKPQQVEYSVGGPVTAALILLSRLGLECDFLASVGKDQTGEYITKKLKQENINLIANQVQKTKTHHVFVNQKTASRTILKDEVIHQPISKISTNLIHGADLIILDRHEPSVFDEVIANKRPDTQVIFDPSTDISQGIIQKLKQIDYPIIPIESLKKFGLACLKNALNKNFIITAGSNGAYIYMPTKKIHIQPAKVKAVDANGAGDVFRGAFGYGLLRGWNIIKTTTFANQIAGLQCTRFGNGTAIPTKEEIERNIYLKTISNSQIKIE